jgi:hypothetical protein
MRRLEAEKETLVAELEKRDTQQSQTTLEVDSLGSKVEMDKTKQDQHQLEHHHSSSIFGLQKYKVVHHDHDDNCLFHAYVFYPCTPQYF